mmetsp:Transcript_11004/g.31889  ORF Transcript_11004/g.31889 Transcript_11004/m.31889 type:complete len:260 (+) Transcript_11004:154-933(+)
MARNPSRHTCCLPLLLVVVACSLAAESLAFVGSSTPQRNPAASVWKRHDVDRRQLQAGASNSEDDAASTDLSLPGSAGTSPPMFPVLNKIAGVAWEGQCRYVNQDLFPASLDIRGGIRFDLPDSKDGGDTVELNSFLVFPNGNRRDVQMRGQRGSLERPSMQLDPTSSGGGPIYTVITELTPDTILINEVDRASGRIVMTSSVSLVLDPDLDPNNDQTVSELVQVSHEVGSPATTTNKKQPMIVGHQVWRFRRVVEQDS